MSVHFMARVWKLSTGDSVTKIVLLKLADNSNDNGVCWPSLRTMAAETDLDRSTICRRLNSLEDRGWIQRKRGGQGSTVYQLTLPGCFLPPVANGNRSQKATGRRKQPVAESNRLPAETGGGGPQPLDAVANSDRGGGPQPPEPSMNHQENHQREPAHAKADDPEEEIQWSEAQRLLSDFSNRFFDTPVPAAEWQNPQKNLWLGEALPFRRKEWAALLWLYGLSETHPALKKTQRRQSFPKLRENLRGEFQKAVSVRKQFGLHRARPIKAPACAPPDGWKEAARDIYGPTVALPAFEQLTKTALVEIQDRIAAKKEKAAA